MADPGDDDDEQHDVFEDPADQEPHLGMPQTLRGQGPLQDHLVRAPVVEVQQVHPDERGPRHRRVIPGQVQVHEVSRCAEELRPAAQFVYGDRDRDESSTEEQDELCEIGAYHGAQATKIRVDRRERPKSNNQDHEPHPLTVADPRHHVGEDPSSAKAAQNNAVPR